MSWHKIRYTCRLPVPLKSVLFTVYLQTIKYEFVLCIRCDTLLLGIQFNVQIHYLLNPTCNIYTCNSDLPYGFQTVCAFSSRMYCIVRTSAYSWSVYKPCKMVGPVLCYCPRASTKCALALAFAPCQLNMAVHQLHTV